MRVPDNQSHREFFSPELCARPSTRRAGKVMACCDPTGADFYEEWLPFAIKCCKCGKDILPSEPAALFDITEHEVLAQVTLTKSGYAVGCYLCKCATGSYVFEGYWTKNGYCPEDKFLGVDTPAQM